jgi:LCP family protein required for cell wall assembly
VSLVTVLVIDLLLGAALWQVYSFEDSVQKEVEDVEPAPEGDPFNILLVGSDSRGDLTEQEQFELGADAVEGERADTLILAHIDPAANRVTMVQFPRDLYISIPDMGENKINSALLLGSNHLVKTVEQFTGLDINNYAEVNIAGFQEVVDAINGVQLCITEPIPFDPATGIEITEEELPLVQFDGERALRFVRSRRFETGDFERIQNQQKFLAAAINKIVSVGTFFDIGLINRLKNAAGDNLKIDAGTGLNKLLDIGRRFRSFDPETYEAYTAPNLGIASNEAGSVVLPDTDSLNVLFKAIKANESPEKFDGVPSIGVATINAGVYNGSAEVGKADAVAAGLLEATKVRFESINIDPVNIGNADRSDYTQTIIMFDPDRKRAPAKAELVAAALPGARVTEGKTPPGVDVAVIVGSEPVEIQNIVQLRPLELPPPGETPAECR